MSDGRIVIDTDLDSSGIEAGLGKLKGVITKGAAALGVGKLAQEVVNVGKSFEAGMSEVQAISGASGKDLQALTNKAKEMGATTKFSATQSAEALKYMAMAGWKTNDMVDGLGGVMNLAAASGEDLGTVSDIVTDALTAFGLQAKDSGHFADVLAKASSNSNTNVSMMGETFKYVAPLAGSMKYSVEEGANKYVHPTSPGYKHIPSGGEETDMLIWSEDGTAAWATPSLTAASTQRGLLMQFKMGSDLVCAGLLNPATTVEFGVMHPGDKAKLDALPSNSTLESTYAKKSDITGVYRPKGSVADASKLPTSDQQSGDVWSIEADSAFGPAGTNVVWTSDGKWDNLGGIVTMEELTQADIDEICV